MDNLIEVILHMDKYLDIIIKTYDKCFYLMLFAVIFAETGFVITPFLPGDSLLFACGSFAAAGILSASKTVFIIFIAAVLGDMVNYHIGEMAGIKLSLKYPRIIRKEYIEKTHSFYERYGSKTIVIARFVPIVRTFAPFIAGVGYMGYKKFVFYNVFGAFLWCLIVFGAGYVFGNIPFIKKNFSLVIILIIIISIFPGVLEYIKIRKNRT